MCRVHELYFTQSKLKNVFVVVVDVVTLAGIFFVFYCVVAVVSLFSFYWLRISRNGFTFVIPLDKKQTNRKNLFQVKLFTPPLKSKTFRENALNIVDGRYLSSIMTFFCYFRNILKKIYDVMCVQKWPSNKKKKIKKKIK